LLGKGGEQESKTQDANAKKTVDLHREAFLAERQW
jgi:hypothetical protein